MKLNQSLKFSSLLLAIAIFAVACAEAPNKEEKETTEEKTEESVEANEEPMEEMEDHSFMLPSPIQIAAMFNRAGLEYKSGLTNPTENQSNYNTKTAKYLNFGVYSADLAYTVLNNQQQESIDYLGAVKNLTDEIGMPSVFGTGELIKSFEQNIGNQDTILRILTTIKRRTDEYLAENEEQSKEAVFFSSAWVEGMYLGANSSSDQTKLTARLVEQITIVEDLIKALKVQNDPSLDLDFLIEGLQSIHDTFNALESVKQFDNSDTGISDVQLTEAELKELTDQINTLRNKIING